jgi:hypothetical protein
VMRTRATLRRAEFGFFGVVVYTRVQTPRRWGAATLRLRPLPDFRPGVASFFLGGLRPIRTSWEVVGIRRRMLPEASRATVPRALDPSFSAAGSALNRARQHRQPQHAHPAMMVHRCSNWERFEVLT